MRSRATSRSSKAASQARAPSARKAPGRLSAARPPVASGLKAPPSWTLRASHPKAAPRLSLGELRDDEQSEHEREISHANEVAEGQTRRPRRRPSGLAGPHLLEEQEEP